ncbi:MAG: hypothetical protein ACOC97_04460 [Myxococcota bacterium]
MGRTLRYLPLLWALTACAASPPPRYVAERDLGGWSYRRYQKTLDVEFPVQDNPAVGHAASYVRRQGPGVHVATAFVTVYEDATGLTAEVRERLDTLSSYDVTVDRVEGEWVWRLEGAQDRWLLWVSENRVVKLGMQEGAVPEALADHYLDVYPSDLDAHGRARDGAASQGKSRREREESTEEALPMPSHLREGAPR